MDKSAAIVCLVMVLICVVPLILMAYFKKRKDNYVLKQIEQLALGINCEISEYGICNDFILAIDKNKKILFFVKKGEEESWNKHLELSDFRSCQIAKKVRNIKTDKESQTIIEKIELIFIPENKNSDEVIWEIYEVSKNLQLSGELQFAEKWSKLINDVI